MCIMHVRQVCILFSHWACTVRRLLLPIGAPYVDVEQRPLWGRECAEVLHHVLAHAGHVKVHGAEHSLFRQLHES